MKLKDFWSLLKETFAEWQEDKASRLAAALSYYTIFSLAPLLVIVIAIAGLFFGEAAARGAIVGQISGLMGQQGAEQVQTMIQNAARPGTGIVASIIGVVLLLVGATGVFGQLQDSMNTIWEVKPKPGVGVWNMIKTRFLSFTMILGIGFLLLVSLVVTAALSALGNMMLSMLPGSQVLMQVVNFLVSFLVITLLFVLMYKFLPDAKIAWKDVFLGAAVTSLLFTIGKMAIGIYLGNSNVTSAFGAAGSLIVLLVWVYYSGQILFFGAEFTQVYANRYGQGVVPKENAVRITEEERAQQGLLRHPRPGRPQGEPPAEALSPQPAAPRTAVPSAAALPVTGAQNDYLQKAEAQRENPLGTLAESAVPALVALLIGIAGSIAIAREQRKRPLGTPRER